MGDVVTPGRVWLRHIKRSATGTTILGTTFAGDADGLNGRDGFVSGQLERRLYDVGTVTLRFPNAAGDDGVLHRDRFKILADPAYAVGDEWIEVWQEGDLLATVTPVSADVSRQEIALSCEDGLAVLRLCREGQFGWWNHAPRDVWEHYCRAWRTVAKGSGSISDDGTLSLVSANLYAGTLTIGTGSADPFRAWKLDATWTVNSPNNGDSHQLQFAGHAITVFRGGNIVSFDTLTGGGFVESGQKPPPLTSPGNGPLTLRVTLEGRDRFIWASVNGTLLGVGLMPAGGSAGYPRIESGGGSDGLTYSSSVSWAFRAADRFLLPNGRGDQRLPGIPPSGTGLGGVWASHGDMKQKADAAGGVTNGTVQRLGYRPGRESVASALIRPPWTDLPAGVPPEQSTGVYTGSIYLDLDHYDYAFRLRTVDDNAEVWVGRTRTGESRDATSYATAAPHNGTATPTWLKAGNAASGAPSGSSGPLAGQPSGWYPVRVEHVQWTGPRSMTLEMSSSASVGTWGTSLPLSWIGTFNQQVRNDSHLDTLQALSSTFGYQFTVAARSLESGEFPGVCEPRVRVGRDTELTLTLPEDAWDAKAQLDATGRSVALQADAQGIADPNSQAQLTAEVIDYAQLDGHLTTPVDYESLADITDPGLLQQRMESLLALRDGPTQTVSATGRGHRQLLDTFPLTGALAEFAWEPGDGIKLDMPEIGVVDTLPRQILGVQRAFTPNGLGPPALSFRPRPRNLIDALRKLRREAILGQRTYQGRIATTVGSLGASATSAATDFASRAQVQIGRLVSATAVVVQKSDASAWDLKANGTTVCQVTATGRYDITALMVDGYNWCALAVIPAVSTGGFVVQLEIHTRA